MRTTNNLILFWSGILSNWAPTPYDFAGEHYCCSEQHYMRYKAMYFGDLETAQLIMQSSNPKEIKRLGRLVKNYNDAEWSKVRAGFMYKCIRAKFTGNERARKFLLKQPANHTFAEASPYDKIWGIGLDENDPRAFDKSTWRGQNLLGYALTQLYNELTQSPNLFNNEHDTQ